MKQEDIRNRAKKLVNDKGIKWKHICKMIGLNDSTLSAYQRGKIDLYPETLAALDDYLKSEGY